MKQYKAAASVLSGHLQLLFQEYAAGGIIVFAELQEDGIAVALPEQRLYDIQENEKYAGA